MMRMRMVTRTSMGVLGSVGAVMRGLGLGLGLRLRLVIHIHCPGGSSDGALLRGTGLETVDSWLWKFPSGPSTAG
jgi:hypothetical protein